MTKVFILLAGMEMTILGSIDPASLGWVPMATGILLVLTSGFLYWRAADFGDKRWVKQEIYESDRQAELDLRNAEAEKRAVEQRLRDENHEKEMRKLEEAHQEMKRSLEANHVATQQAVKELGNKNDASVMSLIRNVGLVQGQLSMLTGKPVPAMEQGGLG